MSASAVRIKPFLKWAGGKYRLLDRILPILSACSEECRMLKGSTHHASSDSLRLVEPFAGACAVFLNAPFSSFLLCDCNADVISLYQWIQRDGESFIRYCEDFFIPSNNAADTYYSFRSRFNQSTDSAERGALLLYLNRHAYNGLVRYNAKGLYNVPFGRYTSPRFPRKELMLFLRRLRETDTEFAVRDFRTTFSRIRHGDIVYCDPPYVPLTATANFTNYSGKTFASADQKELALLARTAAHSGIPVVVSNHATDETYALYAEAALEAFTVRRLISCRGARRRVVLELLAVFGGSP